MKKIISISLLAGTLCISCGEQSQLSDGFGNTEKSSDVAPALTPDQYVKWVKNDAKLLLKKTQLGAFSYSVIYKPVDLIIYNENGNEVPNLKIYNSKKSELQGMEYFDLHIESRESNGELLKINCPDSKNYDERVQYCSFGMQQDIKAIVGKDTVDCALYHFERMFDTAPRATFLLGFPSGAFKNKFDDITILYHDHLFNNGIVKFRFSKQELAGIPQLKI